MRLVFAAALAAASAALASHTLDIVTHDNGSFDVVVDSEVWMSSTDVMARFDGAEVRASNGTLVLAMNKTYDGADGYGSFTARAFGWASGKNELLTTVKFYPAENFAAFTTFWPKGASGVATGDKDSTVSSFPSWNFGALSRPGMGFMATAGSMVGSNPHFGPFDNKITAFPGGMGDSGPFTVFDGTKPGQPAIVVSPAFNFMASSHAFHAPYLQSGVMGNADGIPAGFATEFVVALGRNGGVNDAFDHWGRKLRENFGKGNRRDTDVTMQYLQYSTDNGAYYYYNQESGKSYEQTLKDVWAYAAKEGIPYKNVLLDSWWYVKGVDDGVKEWLPIPEASMFPDGMTAVTNVTGPPIAHNRYWASDNVYAQQNGGDWPWLVEGTISLPLTQGFWDWLMSSSRNWGLRVYEQDWLDTVVDRLPSMSTNVTLGVNWLRQMHHGAAENGITIQYCMSYLRHILQSVELPAVTQARASGDYHSGLTDQWNIGVTSIIADAVGIYPSKDNAWSTASQPGNPYSGTRTEPYSRLQFAVLSFSRGPVAASDGIGMSDASLILRSCTKNGRLLRPDRPMRLMDAAIASKALGSSVSPVNGETWSTYTTVGGATYGHVLAIEVATAFTLTPADLGLDASGQYVVWEANDTSVKQFSASSPVTVGPNDKHSFALLHVSPVGQASGWALVGEADKWVPTSADRFANALDSPLALAAAVKGDHGETVNVGFAKGTGGAITTVSCTIGESGRVSVVMPDARCLEL